MPVLERRGGSPGGNNPSTATISSTPNTRTSSPTETTDPFYPPPSQDVVGIPIWAFLVMLLLVVVLGGVGLCYMSKRRQKRLEEKRIQREKALGLSDSDSERSSFSQPPSSVMTSVATSIKSQFSPASIATTTQRTLGASRHVSFTTPILPAAPPPSPTSSEQFLVNSAPTVGKINSLSRHSLKTVSSASTTESGSLPRVPSLSRPQLHSLDRRVAAPPSAGSELDGVVLYEGPSVITRTASIDSDDDDGSESEDTVSLDMPPPEPLKGVLGSGKSSYYGGAAGKSPKRS
ncbi:hypothetical protein HDU97_004152 [Phlyctochytrium planicorne]|nr:hypothetical protein HDU97_004152 [Phlyctochytrium planicorne]